jgi:hypothetical protein
MNYTIFINKTMKNLWIKNIKQSKESQIDSKHTENVKRKKKRVRTPQLLLVFKAPAYDEQSPHLP